MNRIIKKALTNSLLTALYIVLIVLFLFSLQRFSSQPDKTILIPIAMLLLFVSSAAITGFLVFGKPVMLYLDGKKKEAVALLSYTIGILVLITIIAFIVLITYFNLS